MSEQPVYYSPAPVATPVVAADGTYQYVQPAQPVGTPVVQYTAAVDPNATTLQQPYYPVQSPIVQPQQPYLAQPAIQPAVAAQPAGVYTTTQATSEPVIKPDGKGLFGKIPQVENCCLCFPLHTGAMIIAALMFIFYGYCGLVLVVSGSYSGWYSGVLIVVGVLYLLVALISAYGFAGVYKEETFWVDRFVKFYVIGSLVWFILEFVQMIILVVYYNNQTYTYSYGGYTYTYETNVGFPWAGWIVTLIIGTAFQFYFCACLVSYQRVLHARLGDAETGMQTMNGKEVQMH